MTQAVKTLLLGVLLAFSAAAAAVADYARPPFFVLAGSSDLVVVGTIVKVSPKTFTLRVEEVLAGLDRSEEVEVVRFKDWICSVRWKPYEVGQREVAFLYKLAEEEARRTGVKYGTMSAGDEGEWEILGREVSVQGFQVPGARHSKQGEQSVQWVQLDLVLDAIRRFRRCFSVVEERASRWGKTQLTCSAAELATYRSRSPVHEYLVSDALD